MNMMGPKPQAMPAPAMPEPVRIPNPTDPDVMASNRQKMQDEFANRRGRDSTRLAPAGGDAPYTRTTLG